MKKSKFLISILLCFLFSCGGDDENLEVIENINEPEIQETTTTTVIVEDTATTSTTLIEECIEDNNSNIDFEDIQNLQIFLNRYGFKAGEPDGYFGQETADAVRRFQAFAGLNPDGDAGPKTIEKMQNWTGCEERVSVYTSDTIDTTTTTVVTDTTTTTVVTDTTTTTVVTENASNNLINSYGIIPSISLTDNEVISIFKGINNESSVCGTPYLNKLDSGVLNLYQNGSVANSLLPMNNLYTQSPHTTEIVSESSNEIKIKIYGDGGTNYNFYFIEPFTSGLKTLNASNISTSLNLTEATFQINNLTSGVWFYSFAESGDGTVVKSSGNREFVVPNSDGQNVTSHNGIGKLLITSKSQSPDKFTNVSSGQAFNTNDSINIVYITDSILDNRENVSTLINLTDTTISLKNEDQAYISEILLVGTELMKVLDKNGNNFTVERGYLNTEIKSHEIGVQVKAIKNLNKNTLVSDFAYAVFRNEKGLRFQLPLGPELSSSIFNFNNCNYDRYSLEEVTTFSWRSSGSSTMASKSSINKVTSLFDKSFVINSGGQNYTPPTINSSDQVSGEFLNDGPRNLIVSEGSNVTFNFQGIVDGSSKTEFVKLKFKLIPDTGSTKKTKYKSIYLPTENKNYNFSINISKVISSESSSSQIWEDDYKYIFESITLYDSSTSVEIRNDGKILYDYSSTQDTHEAYYLDQFSFVIKKG